MSGVTGHAQGIGAAHNDSRSTPVYTATTPGNAAARVVSILTMRACACSERLTAKCNAPGMLRSLVNFPSPVRRAGSSRRRRRVPITVFGRLSVIVMTFPFTLLLLIPTSQCCGNPCICTGCLQDQGAHRPRLGGGFHSAIQLLPSPFQVCSNRIAVHDFP